MEIRRGAISTRIINTSSQADESQIKFHFFYNQLLYFIMPNSDVDSNPNPNKSERRPLLKKSRTLSDDFRNSSTIVSSNSLFPSMHRISTSPPSSSSSSSRFSVVGNSFDDDSSENRNVGISDRDWYYPSFLGPHTARNPVKIKATKSSKMELPPLPTLRVQNRSNSDSVSIESSNKKNSVRPSTLTVADHKPEVREVNKRVKVSNSCYALSSSSSSSTNPSFLKRILRFNSSSINLLLISTCILSVLYSAFLRMTVERLQREILNLHKLCGRNGVAFDDNIKVLQFEDETNSSYMYFGNANSRTLALYTVFVVLATPFLLFVCLDYLPYVKTLLKRNENNEEEVPLKKRIAYRVDVFFSVYPYAKLIALLFATILLIGFGGLALYAVSDGSLAEALWLTWTFIADSGNHADRVGTGPRIVSVSISSGGMLIFAMMLGLVSDAISEKVDSLRKGKSEVIERSHILILGWSDKLGSLLKQLAIANKSLGGGVVVVLAERDKEEMEMDIGKLEFDFMGTSVICRSGSPLILADLKKVSVSKARAIIVLASDENADQSDARALRVVLSLSGVKEGLSGHVVVEMSDLDNEPLVKLVGGDFIETVVAHDVIGRLMIQCALQPGLAQIWEDILGFENAEFYIKRWPQLDGLRFEDVLISFPDAVPCGVKVAANGGKIIINPDDDYVLKEGDEVLVIAEDDDTYSPGPIPEVRSGFFPSIFSPPKYPEKILFCGWRRDIDDMIMVLEALLAPGSELWMFNEVPIKEREKKLTDGGLDISGLMNISLVHREGNAVIRRHLESLPLETFDSILILADESVEDSIVQSDSRSLATLLLIRDIQSKRLPYKEAKSTPLRHVGFSHSSWIREMQQASDKSIIISEILDSRTRNLVSVSRISDYVLSNELVSMALAMVAEDKQINRVLEELFAEEGNEMCIRPAEFYLYDQEELCFYDIMLRGRQRQEIVVGYRLATADRAVINPQDKIIPRKWSLDDVFVVISLGE
ncbi:CASTOR/POLLUX/SYM8 ion channel [Macleaya cordata]|uniref:CASTOR/POLLUX/SYM8 ion channel n=1 Tax=Macleaya cordata TaxID=56857 RepID=A0A200PTJ2_MACCD|nr:CASTOR/POLLUX/SYM8 ion channel [Macleaya cordata]